MKAKEKDIQEHNKIKLNREVKELEKLEKDIKENMKELKREIREELWDLDEKAGEWEHIELIKYNRLEKTQKTIREKIKESKNKEKAIVLAFLFLNAKNNDKEIRGMLGNKGGNIKEKDIRAILRHPWSGLTFNERHSRNTVNMQVKVREIVNQGAVNEGVKVSNVIKEVNSQVDKFEKAAFTLADSENTNLNYQATRRVASELSDIYMIYNATLDSVTCNVCSSKHLEVYRLRTQPSLPQHTNCRCFYTIKSGKEMRGST